MALPNVFVITVISTCHSGLVLSGIMIFHFQKRIASKLIYSKKHADLDLEELRLLSSSDSEVIAIGQCTLLLHQEPRTGACDNSFPPITKK